MVLIVPKANAVEPFHVWVFKRLENDKGIAMGLEIGRIYGFITGSKGETQELASPHRTLMKQWMPYARA